MISLVGLTLEAVAVQKGVSDDGHRLMSLLMVLVLEEGDPMVP